jgi:glycoprotein-N-acetylgalactosamine 3-beta-galactosyltransferase
MPLKFRIEPLPCSRLTLIALLTIALLCADNLLSNPAKNLLYFNHGQSNGVKALQGNNNNHTNQTQNSRGDEPSKVQLEEASPPVAKQQLQQHQQQQQPQTNSSSPPRAHPHAGARYPDETIWGYVADPTSTRKHMLSLYKNTSDNVDADYNDMLRFLPLDTIKEETEVCGKAPGKGYEGPHSWNMLTQKIKIGGPDPLPLNVTTNTTTTRTTTMPPPPFRNGPKPPRILCAVYTYEGRHALLQSQAQTWGWRCDGFLGFSTKTVPAIGAVDLPHEGKENYGNMWQKVRSIWAYIYDNYYDDFDYIHLSGDDNHFVIENMQNYLWSVDDKNGTLPLYMGHLYKKRGVTLCGGGSGYTLNKVALRRFVTELLPICDPDVKTSAEDRLIGFCFRTVGIRCHDTADARGEQRYMPHKPNYVATYNGDKNRNYKVWASHHGWKFKDDLISSQHVSWHHLKNAFSQKRIHAIMYRTCPKGTVLGDAFKSLAS